ERSRQEYSRPPKSQSRAGDRGTAGRGATADRGPAEKDSGETQTVAGREFHKRGEVWIDTAYTYQSATKVARGSEQYRALVADEPGIHTIAETLKSEFIVVWKGRAYHIR
ncbi:MAG TPA: hypothetical protein VJS17_08925, partial [Pyrinomonadaceae bacterium]|nr:hypothetical protein [Pyrinomonadaceae bacterium]